MPRNRKPKDPPDEIEAIFDEIMNDEKMAERILTKYDTFDSLFDYCAAKARKRFFKRYGIKPSTKLLYSGHQKPEVSVQWN